MSRILIISFLVLLLAVSPLAAQRPNPLLEMMGRDCGEYFDKYQALNDSLFSGDSLSRAELLNLFTEAAATDPSGEWEYDRRRMEGHRRFHESRNGGYTSSVGYTAEKFADDLLAIARQAEEKGFKTVSLHALFDAAAVFRIFTHDYERAFKYYLEVASEVEKMPIREFPWKFYLFLETADFYFSFREYKDAARFYRLIAADPEMAADNPGFILRSTV